MSNVIKPKKYAQTYYNQLLKNKDFKKLQNWQ